MLDAWGVSFTDHNIRADMETMLAFRRKGYMEVPVVEGPGFVLTEYIDPEQLRTLLREHGYPV